MEYKDGTQYKYKKGNCTAVFTLFGYEAGKEKILREYARECIRAANKQEQEAAA